MHKNLNADNAARMRRFPDRGMAAANRALIANTPGRWVILSIWALCFGSSVLAAPSYSLDWDVIAGGGGVSTAGCYTLVDTLGQPDAGVATSEVLRWEAGFLPGLNLQPAGNASTWVTDEDMPLLDTLTGSDLDGDLLTFTLDTSPTHGTVVVLADGSFTYNPATNYNGDDSFTFKVNDGEFDSPSATVTLTINPVNDPPVVDCALPEQTVQYSDPIAEVIVTANDVDSLGDSLTATTTWQKDGGAPFPGLPTGLVLDLTSTTDKTDQVNTTDPADHGRTWTLSGWAQVAPGYYLIHIMVTDDQAGAVTTNIILRVTPEDARPVYTGALFASTASASSGLATVTLSATIQDITAVSGDPAYDSWAGDIHNATVAFINRDNNTVIAADVPVGLVSLSDLTTGTATYNWRVDIGSADSQSITVGIVVNGWYTRDVSVDDTVVTVSRPLASDFITGGGYLLLCRSAGLCAGDSGTKANFGFNVKYNKSGKNLQGHLNAIVRSAGRVYQAKGNVMSSLSIAGNQATFNGKASILDITDPRNPISIDGNATLQVVMTDEGDLGTTDTIAITIWNKKGGLWFASNWSGSKTTQQTLAAGNLIVHSSRKLSLTALPTADPPANEALLLRIERLMDLPAAAGPYPFMLRFPVAARADYAIERSTDLLTWTHLTTVMSFTDAVEYFDEAHSGTLPQFYRVRTAGDNPSQLPDLNLSEP